MSRTLKTFIAVLTVMPALALAASLQGLPTSNTSAPVQIPIIEYYNGTLDHYFITGDPDEISILDSGTFSGWSRTGLQFNAFAANPPGSGLQPVCRYYGRPDAGLNSHFYSASPEECAAVFTKFSFAWTLESNNVFQIVVPDVTTGMCPQATIPVYRIFNGRTDANHRYTTDPAIRQRMLSLGGVSEGYGLDGVAFCAPVDIPQTGEALTPLAISIVATALSPDMFSFSSSVVAAAGIASMAYTWSFGDGATASGPSATHQFDTAGVYVVTLKVTDSKGAAGTAARSVTVSKVPNSTTRVPTSAPTSGSGNPSTPSDSSDFNSRKSGPGVVRSFGFESAAELKGPPRPDGRAMLYGVEPGEKTTATLDTTVKASGNSSLRFDVPSNSGSNAAGAFFANFSDDLSVRFGENSEFYVQWRQRFNQAFVDTFFTEDWGDGKPHAQGGIKQIDIAPGDTPDRGWASCEATEIVITTYLQHRIPVGYNSCTGSASHSAYSGFYEPAAGDFKLQNATSTGCLYSQNQKYPGEGPGCFTWVANEWMTFKLWVKLGPRNNVTGEFDNSEVKLWGARDGQPSQLLIWWRPGIPGYFPLTAGSASDDQRLGKVWLMPYMTNKDPKQAHELCQTWYDDLIISRQDIPDPGVTRGSAGSTSTATSALPKWRQGRTVGQWFEIPNTSNMGGVIPPEWSATVDAWNGLAAGPTTWWSAASSGHGTWWNPVIKIDLSQDVPNWRLEHASSRQQDVNFEAYYADGLPTSRHTYATTQFLSAESARDGKERIMLFGSYSTYGIGHVGVFDGGPIVDGFRTGDDSWDAANTWSSLPFYVRLPSVARDPRSGEVYYAGSYTVARWDPKKDQWSVLQGRPGYSDTGMAPWDKQASVVDIKRNRLVGLINAKADGNAGPVRLEWMDLTTLKLGQVLVTGDLTYVNEDSVLLHDTDNDRYLYFRGSDTSDRGIANAPLFEINPETGASTIVGTYPAPIFGVDNRASFFPALGGIAYLPKFSSNIFFMPTR